MSEPFALRLTWAQPEDLVAHFFSQSQFEGVDVDDQIATWVNAGVDLQLRRWLVQLQYLQLPQCEHWLAGLLARLKLS